MKSNNSKPLVEDIYISIKYLINKEGSGSYFRTNLDNILNLLCSYKLWQIKYLINFL